MSSENERHAWQQFRERMQIEEPAYDGQVPVLLLCAPLCTRGPSCHGNVEQLGGVHVDLNAALSTLRVAELQREDLIRMLTRLLLALRNESFT